jgi:hypothetical protein
VNLPEYSPQPPTAKLNWGHYYKPTDPKTEVNMLWRFLRTYVTDERLTDADLICCYVSRRVVPL